jgi:predicted DNA repair protein MutK
MAGTSLIALLDDIASVLDDISILTKVAARKTAGVLGDDLALNAEQVTGIRAERELPVVWAVAKGSLVNKAILVPAALAISAVAPWAILPLLMVGGAFLCYEGFEKLAHKLLHSRSEDEKHHAEITRALQDPSVDLAALERDKIKGAVRTDFVLSAEIIVITLGIVAGAAFGTQVAVLAGIGLVMTVGVYGLVAGIVKLDDLGIFLSRRDGEGAWPRLMRWLGGALLRAAPWLMKLLSVVGTAAMFLVGGGIVTHGTPGAHEVIHQIAHWAGTAPLVGGTLAAIAPFIMDGLTGILVGAVILGAVTAAGGVWQWLEA